MDQAISEPSAIRDDPQARALLKEAHAHTYRWATTLPGFTAGVNYSGPEGAFSGTVRIVLPPGSPIAVDLPDEASRQWVTNELAMIVGHRAGGRSFEEGDGRNTLTFGSDDNHPAGRLVLLNDRFQSSYRVRDQHMWQVNRSMPAVKFTIDVTDSQSTPGGNLTNAYTVSYFDPASGALQSVDNYSDTFAEVGGDLLPERHTIVSQPVSGDFLETRSMLLRDHHIL